MNAHGIFLHLFQFSLMSANIFVLGGFEHMSLDLLNRCFTTWDTTPAQDFTF
jgi:hypothetical protein